jgi:hypothetical protein
MRLCKKNPRNRELSKVFDFLKIALRTVLVFLIFNINIFKNDIFVHFSFVFIYFGLKIKLLWKNFFLKTQNGGIILEDRNPGGRMG